MRSARCPLKQARTQDGRAIVIRIQKHQNSSRTFPVPDGLLHGSFQFALANHLSALHPEGARDLDIMSLPPVEKPSQKNRNRFLFGLTFHNGNNGGHYFGAPPQEMSVPKRSGWAFRALAASTSGFSSPDLKSSPGV